MEIAELVTTRTVSASEVVAAALSRLASLDGALRAFRTTWPDRAAQIADAVDRAVARGRRLPLAGVPIGLKAWDGVRSLPARRLLRAGCVPLGETAVPLPSTPWQTWGYTDRGPTVNPWRPDRVPGGSSAGSAAAVAAGVVPLATGTDGAGSIRIPAAWCGVLGFKPTNGRLATGDPAGLRVGGPLAATVADTAAYLDVTLGTALSAALSGPCPHARAVWADSVGQQEVDPQVAAIAQQAAERLAAASQLQWAGATVRLMDPAPAWQALRAPAESDLPGAARIRAENDRRLAELFARVDLLLTPTTPGPPHGHDGPGEIMNVSQTWAFNLSGHPAVSVPAGMTTAGNPVGLQLVARHHHEALLIHMAAIHEQVTPWPTPPLDRLRMVPPPAAKQLDPAHQVPSTEASSRAI